MEGGGKKTLLKTLLVYADYTNKFILCYIYSCNSIHICCWMWTFFLSPVFGVVSFTGPLWSWIPHTHKDNKNNFQTSSLPHPHLPPLCYTLTLHYITNQSSLQGGWGQWSTGWAALSHTHTQNSVWNWKASHTTGPQTRIFVKFFFSS